jgi:hypothetical protein
LLSGVFAFKALSKVIAGVRRFTITPNG